MATVVPDEESQGGVPYYGFVFLSHYLFWKKDNHKLGGPLKKRHTHCFCLDDEIHGLCR